MLFAVHHPPYNITMLFIELSEDGECFAVDWDQDLFTILFVTFISFFIIMNFVLQVRCLSVYSASYLFFL